MRSEPAGATPLTLIGDPTSRRVTDFATTARRLGWQVTTVSYPDLIRGLAPEPPLGTQVRIESPGDCDVTARLILRAGNEPLAALGGCPLSAAEIAAFPMQRGVMLPLRQWFLGYSRILAKLDNAWSPRRVQWLSKPQEIVTTFDKAACLARWTAAGLPVPRRHPGINSYEQMRTQINRPHARLFLKPRYGYSAMGAVALEWRGSLMRAITTAEVVTVVGHQRIFVSKRPQVIRDEAKIAWLIDALAADEILVEDWLPKARCRGLPFDLRIVTIAGRVQHVVGRASVSPFTNLNLDARRIDRETVIELLGEAWEHAHYLTERAADCVPGCSMLGIDLLVHPGGKKFALLEANAFGDNLPGLLFNGQSTYEAELHAWRPPLQESA